MRNTQTIGIISTVLFLSVSGAGFDRVSPTAAFATPNFQKQAASPDSLIRDLYKTHAKNPGAIVQGRNRAILNKYFDKNLSALIWKDVTAHRDEVGAIDFDIFYNTQDAVISRLMVGAAKITSDRASVAVTFYNGGAKNLVTYKLVKENSLWKISDISYGKNESLLKYFAEA